MWRRFFIASGVLGVISMVWFIISVWVDKALSDKCANTGAVFLAAAFVMVLAGTYTGLGQDFE